MSNIITDSLQVAHMADSIRQVQVADSLRQVFVADSLHQVYVADSISAARLVAQQSIFGQESTLCDVVTPVTKSVEVGVDSLVSNPVYIMIIIAFALLYFVWLPHIVKGGGIKWSHLKPHRHVEGEGERIIVGKQRIGVVIATWSLAIVLFSLFSARLVAQFSNDNIEFEGATWILGGVVGVVAMAIYGWGVLRIGGYLSLTTEFVGKILSMKRQLLIFSIIFASPLFIIAGLANYNQGEAVLQLAMVVAIVFVVALMRQSFLLFMRQKISIVHWFLYLCGVEILPLTFIWAITTRYVLV